MIPAASRTTMDSSGGGLSTQAAAGHRTAMSQGNRRRTSMPSSAGSNLSDSINLQVLKHLEDVFHSADKDGSGKLDMDEFVKAFKGVISTPEGTDDESLSKLFMRIDSNCDAKVDWNEFSAYLLLEKTTSSGAAAVPGSGVAAGGQPELSFNSLVTPGSPAAAAHKDLISGVMHVDNGMGPDKWYSTSRDGTVKLWNGKDLSPLRTLQTPLQCILCSAYLMYSNLLAVGGYNPSVLLLDPASGEQAGVLQGAASSAAISVTAWQEERDVLLGESEGRELLAVGDADGGVNLVHVKLDEMADKKSKNRFQGTTLWRAQNHHDWVSSVLYMPDLNSILAASLDKNLTMTDTERCIAVKILQGHSKSVTCCGWSGTYKMAVSGSEDKTVMLWNPFSCRPLGTLTGHAAGIVAMAVNEKESQILTAATDKTIKVWDLRNQRCLQTLTDTCTYYPENKLSALAYSSDRKLLVSCAYYPKGWNLMDNRHTGGAGHRDPISWVGYNKMFCEAVSTDHAGLVCVWHIPTGRLRFCFGNTHGGARISVAAFDSHHRRLITGGDDGSVKVWNFSSGTLLTRLAVADASHDRSSGSGPEVTGLAVFNSNQTQNIIVTGWDRKVSWYDDSGKRVSKLLRSSGGPGSDVLSAALMQDSPTLATALYDGEIWMWNLDSGAVRRKLIIAGHARKPENEQAVEKITFMHGDVGHVLVAVGADRVIRFWDTFTGACLAEQFTGHKQGESVAALTLSPDNTTVVTADTAGYIMVWDISGLRLPSSIKSQARPASASMYQAAASAATPHGGTTSSTAQSAGITRIAVWRGHHDAVTALDWIPPPAAAAALAAAESTRLTAAAADDDAFASGSVTAREGTRTNQIQQQGPIRSLQQQELQQSPDSSAVPQQSSTVAADEQPSMQQRVQTLDMRQFQEHGASSTAGSTGYVVSTSLDKSLVLWSSSGAMVGVFGRHNWVLDDLGTWQAQTRAKLRAGEKFDMLVSSKAVQLKPLALQQHIQPTLQPADQDVPPASCRPQSARLSISKSSNNSPLSARNRQGMSTATADSTVGAGQLSRGDSSRAMDRPGSPRPVSRSRKASAVGFTDSTAGGTDGPISSRTASGPATGAGDDTTAERRTTAASVALVCQASMKQRANVLKTLGSIKQQSSVLTDDPSAPEGATSSKCSQAEQLAELFGGDGSYQDLEIYDDSSSSSSGAGGSDDSQQSSADPNTIEQQQSADERSGPQQHSLQEQHLDPQQQELQRARAAIAAAKLQIQQNRRPMSAAPVMMRSRVSRVGFADGPPTDDASPGLQRCSMIAGVSCSSLLSPGRCGDWSAATVGPGVQQPQIARSCAPAGTAAVGAAVSPGRSTESWSVAKLLQSLQERPSSSAIRQRGPQAVGAKLTTGQAVEANSVVSLHKLQRQRPQSAAPEWLRNVVSAGDQGNCRR